MSNYSRIGSKPYLASNSGYRLQFNKYIPKCDVDEDRQAAAIAKAVRMSSGAPIQAQPQLAGISIDHGLKVPLGLGYLPQAIAYSKSCDLYSYSRCK